MTAAHEELRARVVGTLPGLADDASALVADGWEGTVAKRTTGRYRCDRRSNAWVKLKSPAARDRERRRFLASLAA